MTILLSRHRATQGAVFKCADARACWPHIHPHTHYRTTPPPHTHTSSTRRIAEASRAPPPFRPFVHLPSTPSPTDNTLKELGNCRVGHSGRWNEGRWRPTNHFADSGCAACAERQRERNGQRECVGAWGLVFVCVGERWGAPFFSALSCDKSKTRQGGGVQGGRQQEGERNILLPCLGAFDMAVVYVNWILLIYTTLYIPVQSRTWCYSFGVSRLQILHSVLSHAQLVSKTGLMASRGGSS